LLNIFKQKKLKKMKKFIFSMLIAGSLVVSMNSCEKCEKCKLRGVTYFEVCEKDYATKAEYEEAVADFRAFLPNC
jgi:hypothetical protein